MSTSVPPADRPIDAAPAPAPAAPRRGEGRFGPFEVGLYAITVFAWSTSWIAMKAQIGVVQPEVSLLWRFLIAAGAMWIWAGIKGSRLRFGLGDHLRFAALGALLFSTNFDLFYHGASHLPSGLLSVVFSLASVVNLLMGRVLFGHAISGKVALGALIGFLGVAAMFRPQLMQADFAADGALGLGLCVLGTICFCSGNMVSSRIQLRGVSVVSASAWGMSWGCVFLAIATAVGGLPVAFDTGAPYVISLLWLSLVSSVAAFWAYLTLLGRIGAGRAGYATVMFPVFALAISTAVEGYVWTVSAAIGLALVLAGNLFVLRR
ncbi:DMT family transporter [Siculibacillus lacustris]|uniref:DMT family transporter n=1 Tax=Siculibacillus lacustris TaxID=1549641 RepID=A0A4Q9VNQ5_9HYPH|nr:DMT family transporter [Siculibacillus lacustris]TBW37209.1 DMT family transporter [Siculibacillus lacustris]